ncbi:hypothetical protein IWZ03DRAFT_420624 [Phyllosticta citriasiana]|uniref:Uncharacterized protein n=1 Tax=Phyllosticta citriasiana TaxID=595635 RepID=A0ABR1L150_9PEZI
MPPKSTETSSGDTKQNPMEKNSKCNEPHPVALATTAEEQAKAVAEKEAVAWNSAKRASQEADEANQKPDGDAAEADDDDEEAEFSFDATDDGKPGNENNQESARDVPDDDAQEASESVDADAADTLQNLAQQALNQKPEPGEGFQSVDGKKILALCEALAEKKKIPTEPTFYMDDRMLSRAEKAEAEAEGAQAGRAETEKEGRKMDDVVKECEKAESEKEDKKMDEVKEGEEAEIQIGEATETQKHLDAKMAQKSRK